MDIFFTADEARILGVMVEKAMTTPANYPMSLNAVTVACNQVSNRDPVVDYGDDTVERTLRALADRGLAKMVHRPGDRVVKYRHALSEALEIDDRTLALLSVLMLRGAQTPGELRQRTGRHVAFGSLPEVETTLESMRAADIVRRLDRRPGQKENRYVELLSPRASGGQESVDGAEASDVVEPILVQQRATGAGIDVLRDEVAELRARFELLLEQLGVDDL